MKDNQKLGEGDDEKEILIGKKLHFFLKLDLSGIFGDARKRSVILVNTRTMSTVEHVRKRILQILDLHRPIYLAMNLGNTVFYIPPMEDIQILMDEQIYLVLAESISLEPWEEPQNSEPAKDSTVIITNSKVDVLENNTAPNTVEKFPVASTPKSNESNCEGNASQAMQSIEKNLDLRTRQNGVDNMEFGDNSNGRTGRKRKRVRRKKGKDSSMINKETDGMSSFRSNATEEAAKPKIVHSCILPTTKHIRFYEDVSDTEMSESSASKIPKGTKQENGLDSTTGALSALLALRGTSMTFEVEKSCTTGTRDVVNGSIEEIEDRDTSVRDEKRKENVVEDKKELGIDDRVVFQILRIGDDYTPQISRPIVADVISCSADTNLYNFRIIEGKEEIREPNGKFNLESLEDEKEENKAVEGTDTVSLHYHELLHLRILPSNKGDIPGFQNNSVHV